MKAIILVAVGMLVTAHLTSASNLQPVQSSNEAFTQLMEGSQSRFYNINFNIPNLTAVSQMDPIRPGLTPDWGTTVFEGRVFENLTFEACSFRWLNFSRAVFRDVKFKNCQFEGAVFDQAIFCGVEFEGCDLKEANFYKSELFNTIFKENRAVYVSFMDAKLFNVAFVANDLAGSQFLGAQAEACSIVGETKKAFMGNLAPGQIAEQPLVLVSWNNVNPGLAVSKIQRKLQDMNAILVKFNFQDPDINCEALKREVTTILEQWGDDDTGRSRAKFMLDHAKQGYYPEIAKIQHKAKAWVTAVSSVLIPGGDRVDPLFYGNPRSETVKSDYRRDVLEFAILDEAESQDKPILAVCRGAQLMNVWRGGTIKLVEGHLYQAQTYTSVENGGILGPIFARNEKPFIGYAFHRQASDAVGQGLTVTVLAEDGTIKALEDLSKRFIVSVQWHPECQGDTTTPEAIAFYAPLSFGNHEIYQEFMKATCERAER